MRCTAGLVHSFNDEESSTLPIPHPTQQVVCQCYLYPALQLPHHRSQQFLENLRGSISDGIKHPMIRNSPRNSVATKRLLAFVFLGVCGALTLNSGNSLPTLQAPQPTFRYFRMILARWNTYSRHSSGLMDLLYRP